MLKALILLSAATLAVAAVPQLGAKRCTWGPSYWCSNITNAAGCNAVNHCIQTVWVHKQVPEDTDTVCQTCLKMVKEARDQLESNETQEEIKEVFEGSCKLIPIKLVNKECCKLADEFIPELIDTLASEMNPNTVCSVAGLCNSERVDKLIEEYEKNTQVSKVVKPRADDCENCHTVIGIMEDRLNTMTQDEVLQSLLKVCGLMGSFSDACSNIMITYFEDIYVHLKNNFNADQFCLMAGECYAQFHTHANVEITPLSHVGYVAVDKVKDDLPCDLCKQLVNHLKDLLVTNTTENEFKMVLQGLCKQTGKFKDECLGIVNQYYDAIYNFLTSELNANEVCKISGICPNTDGERMIMPLLSSEAASKVKTLMQPKPVNTFQSPELMQLPIERLTPAFGQVYDNEVCVFCEYFLHYVQQAITSPKLMDDIKKSVDQACEHLPSSINETCVAFVNTYGDAIVAILAQEIDPSVVCPLVRACPSNKDSIEVFMQAKPEKPNCPLCLLAVTKLEDVVTNKHSKQSIRDALASLCNHLSGSIKAECVDFVNTYSDELVEMLFTDFTPQEICVYLKLCTDKTPAPTLPPMPKITDATFTTPTTTTEFPNAIFDDTVNGQSVSDVKVQTKPECVMCEFAMDQLEHMLQNKTTEDEIKHAVHSLCNHLPKSVKQPCNNFVDQYAELVIDLLAKSVKPAEICAEIHLCDPTKKVAPKPVPVKSPQCVLCKMIITQLEKLIDTDMDKTKIENAVHQVCNHLPGNMKSDCNTFIDKHGDQIIELLSQAIQPGELCSIMFICSETIDLIRLEVTKCAVCEQVASVMQRLLRNPNIDHEMNHIHEKSCRALSKKDQSLCRDMVDIYGGKLYHLIQYEQKDEKSVCHEVNLCSSGRRQVRSAEEKPKQLLGEDKCTDGPIYWCESLENANECHAVEHCLKYRWNIQEPLA